MKHIRKKGKQSSPSESALNMVAEVEPETSPIPTNTSLGCGDVPIQSDAETVERTASPSQNEPKGLPPDLRQGIELLAGIPMNDVRVHRNSARPARLDALAYAEGLEIQLAPGQEQHLAHEA